METWDSDTTQTETPSFSPTHEALLAIVTITAGGNDTTGPMTRQLVRLLRRSIADIPEADLREILLQCRQAIDSVITPVLTAGTIDAEVIEIDRPTPELEMTYGDVSNALATGE